eukprot:TRINITY_DN10999_c0_g1_i1.p1 TRINITY_DN10999_c0_g1~~TRINITY_DN10999_c0_g1_i1.p1  ORF type:complete len:328 (-),score=40.72 TRINITY_DN10999_c0_g1_i1:13-996(-)
MGRSDPTASKKKLIGIAAFFLIVEVLFISALLTRGKWELGDPSELLMRIRKTGHALPILIPAYNRPEVLKEVLKALSNCRNINETAVIISQDGNKEGVADVIASFASKLNIVHYRHKQPYFGLLGGDVNVSWNTYFLLSLALDDYQFDAVIVLEADLQPSVDFYEFMKWGEKQIIRNKSLKPQVFTVSSFNLGSQEENNPRTDLMIPYNHTSLLGWVMTDEHWADVRPAWGWFGNWDISLGKWRKEHRSVTLVPRVSRVKHIGLNDGINFRQAPNERMLEKWLGVKMPTKPIDYSNVTPKYMDWNLTSGEYKPCKGFWCSEEGEPDK